MLHDRSRTTPTQQVGRHFDRTASAFDSLYHGAAPSRLMGWINRRFRADIDERFRRTLDHVAAVRPRSVLDIGCGSGRYLEALAQPDGRRLVGLDVSENMLAMARSRLDRLRDCHVELVAADFAQWPSDEVFEVVVAMGFFDYVADPAAALVRMAQRAGHSVVASFPSRHWLRMPLRKARYLFKACPVRFYSRRQIASMAEAAGFKSWQIDHTSRNRTSYFAVLLK